MGSGINVPIWRYIEDGAGGAAMNMAQDEALLDSVVMGIGLPALRLYRWDQTTISLGRFQSVERTLDHRQCIERNIPLVRRITGGRGILHGDDLTVSLVCPVADLNLASDANITAIYERTARGFLMAFDKIGIEAVLGIGSSRSLEVRGDCFATISRADIVDRRSGQKLLGAALNRREHAILQQISIPLHSPQFREKLAADATSVFRGASAFPEESSYTTLDPSLLSQAILQGLEQTLGVQFNRDSVTIDEQVRAVVMANDRYSTLDWSNYRLSNR